MATPVCTENSVRIDYVTESPKRQSLVGSAAHSWRAAQARLRGVGQSSVAKYMVKRCGPPSQGWYTFLRNHAPNIAAMDLFVVPTIGFDLLYVLVVVRLARRDLVWINVTSHPTAEWIARQITEAFPWNGAPTMKCEHIDRWTKTRPSRARSSGPAASCHMLSSVDCITTTCASEFLVHIGLTGASLSRHVLPAERAGACA
jgi:hypothetical protein